MMPIHSAQANIQLPNELLLAIITELAAEYNDTAPSQAALASCRLASRVLCSLATPLLFSSLKWDYRRGLDSDVSFLDRGKKLDKLLSIHHITALLHTFTLCCEERILRNSKAGPLVSEILYRLQHIQNLTFKFHWTHLSFYYLPSDCASAIKALCKSPNLTTLELAYIVDFPLRFIALCPSLRCLRLTSVHIEDGNSMDDTSSLRPSYLDSLEIDVTDPHALAGSKFAKSFSRIRNLRIKRLSAEQSGWDLILLASQTLTTLDLTRHDESETRPGHFLKGFPFDLGQLPALRLLKIQLEILSLHNFFMLPFLNSLLSNSSSASGIETLDLQFVLYPLRGVHSEDEFANLLASGGEWQWDTLDEVLTSEMFASLRKVVLDFGLEVSDRHRNSGYDNLALSFVNDLFPMLRRGTRTLETHVKYL